MTTTRSNPCKGREVGCTGNASPRCENCRLIHNAREAARRAARKAARKCVVCGKRAVMGLTVCAVHREYYRARAAS